MRSDEYERAERTSQPRARTGDMVFGYSCAQSDGREKKPKVPKGKSRDTRRMERFPGHGWLFIAVAPDDAVITIKLKHESHHHAYLDLFLPESGKHT